MSLATSLIPLLSHGNTPTLTPQSSTSQGHPPVIDWSARVSPTPAVRPLGKPDAAWTRDFVVNLGQSDSDRKPSDKLRLPVQPAAKAKVAARVRS
jgi:hypothetical protein